MSARDELALAMRQNFSGWMGPAVSYDVADAILAAGYRKPQQVTTVEELDALPGESLILDAVSQCRESAKLLTDSSNLWRSMGPAKVRRSNEIPLPATVLHVGGAE